MTVSTLEPKIAHVAPQTHTKSPRSQFERYDTIDTPKIVVVGFVSAILTFVVILGAQAIFFAADNVEQQRKIADDVPTALTEGLTQQQNRLAGYAWVDASKGIVSIPVADAMRMTVAEQHKTQKVAGAAL